MLRIAIAVCVAAQQAAKLVNENGDLNVNLGSASNKFCISGGGDKGCLLAGDVVGKAYVEEYVEEVKTEFLEKTAAQLDERIQVLETDLNDKVDSVRSLNPNHVSSYPVTFVAYSQYISGRLWRWYIRSIVLPSAPNK